MKTQQSEFSWNLNQYTWSNNPYTWNECTLAIQIITGGGGIVDEWKQHEPKKYKKVIQLICKIKDVEEIKQTKEVRTNIDVDAEDIQLIVDKIGKKYLDVEINDVK